MFKMNLPGIPSRQKGFSLLEILIALLILSIITTLAINRYAERTDDARRAAAQAEINQIVKAEQQCEIDTGYYVSLRALDDPPGGGTMVIEPNGVRQYRIDNEFTPYAFDTAGQWFYNPIDTRNWKGPYITYQNADTTGTPSDLGSYGSPLDPWGRNYKLFTRYGLTNPKLTPPFQDETMYVGTFDRYAIVSYGKDGLPGNGNPSSTPGQGDDVIIQF